MQVQLATRALISCKPHATGYQLCSRECFLLSSTCRPALAGANQGPPCHPVGCSYALFKGGDPGLGKGALPVISPSGPLPQAQYHGFLQLLFCPSSVFFTIHLLCLYHCMVPGSQLDLDGHKRERRVHRQSRRRTCTKAQRASLSAHQLLV